VAFPPSTGYYAGLTEEIALDEPARPPGLTSMTGDKRPEPDALWYKDAVIYEVHVRAFFDSNDDGIGDFAGLTRKLDYIHSLGVNTIWLLPFYPSPQKDDGYDISDYHGIHSSYGTRADFRTFVREAHRRGLRVITELVINHTSDQHPWFQAARAAPAGSSKRDFYVWSDTDDRYADARIIFTDTEKSNWTWDPVAKAYYWHRFFSHQPDLNFDNPRVARAVGRIMRYWLAQGVDGLRLDAIPYLVEREGTSCENLRETHSIIKQLRHQVESHFPDRMLLAEANQWPEDVRDYFGDGDECHMAYHFPLMPRMYMAIAQEDRHPIADILSQTPEIPASCQWAIFLRNHDELTLEMVTDRERDYMFRMFAADPKSRINIGIRRRLAPLMENDADRIKLINSLLLSMPGSPIIYFGDEIGMGDNFFLGDRDGVRTPMQWSPDRNAGFSRADPQRLFLPPIMDPVYGYEAVNVEAQERDRSSLLHWMRRMLRVRGSTRAFGRGTLRLLRPGNRKILAYLRQYGDETLLCVANLGRHAQAVELPLGEFKGRVPIEMIGEVPFPPVGELPYMLTLPGHAFYWFRLALGAESPPWHMDQLPREELPALVLFDGWNSFVRDRVVPWRSTMAEKLREQLEHEVLPGFFATRRWYIDGDAPVRRVELVDVAEGRSDGVRWLFGIVDVQADAARAAVRYQLPLALTWEDEGTRDLQIIPVAIARVREHARVGTMVDALLYEPCVREIVEAIGRNTDLPCERGRIRFKPTTAFARLRDGAEEHLRVEAAPVQGSNTGLALGDRLFLKAYRRLAAGTNPELEIGRFLTEVVPFRHAAALAGSVEYVDEHGSSYTLAVLQQFIPNQGNAWDYTQEYLARFLDDVSTDARSQPKDLHGAFLEMVGTLGTRTAQLHQALATTTGDPAFDPRPVESADVERWTGCVRAAAETTLAELKQHRTDWPPAAVASAGALLTQGGELLKRIEAIAIDRPSGLKARHHGNYELGQVLVVHNDFAIVDFEAEVRGDFAATLDSPLRDVAGLLRSLVYAGEAAFDKAISRQPDDASILRKSVDRWIAASRERFIASYEATMRTSRVCPPLPDARRLIDLFELERNLRDARFELGRRHDSLHVSLRSLLRLVGRSATGASRRGARD
jgi:maltose alpha-D-glucosyltransferase/alpha-amylase